MNIKAPKRCQFTAAPSTQHPNQFDCRAHIIDNKWTDMLLTLSQVPANGHSKSILGLQSEYTIINYFLSLKITLVSHPGIVENWQRFVEYLQELYM